MFQDMNVAKSTRAINYIPKIHVSPQSSQKTPVSANYAKFADHFSIWTTRTGNLKFHSKLREICSIRQPPQRIT